jgi:hypothetical protein
MIHQTFQKEAGMWGETRKTAIGGGAIFTIIALFIMSIGNPASAAPARVVVRDGTVKAADGQLLRGTSLHISKSYSSRNLTWGLDKNNLIKLRDQGHLNLIRLNCLDPRAVVDGRPGSAFSTIAEEAVYVDSVIANCGAVGLNVCLDYHCMGMVYDMSTWDIRNFWDFYAPRYKDKTWVMYEIENEVFGGNPPSGGVNDWPTNNEADIYKNHVRKWAPNTIIATGMEPVECVANWGPYLKTVYGPACGIDWTAGKDVWPWHDYGGTTESAVLGTKNSGVPIFCTEFSYAEDGWYNTTLGGCHLVAQWCEKNGISWCDWKSWNAADQYISLQWLIPDATSKGWAWWTTSGIHDSRKAGAVSQRVDFTAHAATMIQANGRMLPDQMRDEKRDFQLSLWPDMEKRLHK